MPRPRLAACSAVCANAAPIRWISRSASSEASPARSNIAPLASVSMQSFNGSVASASCMEYDM